MREIVNETIRFDKWLIKMVSFLFVCFIFSNVISKILYDIKTDCFKSIIIYSPDKDSDQLGSLLPESQDCDALVIKQFVIAFIKQDWKRTDLLFVLFWVHTTAKLAWHGPRSTPDGLGNNGVTSSSVMNQDFVYKVEMDVWECGEERGKDTLIIVSGNKIGTGVGV